MLFRMGVGFLVKDIDGCHLVSMPSLGVIVMATEHNKIFSGRQLHCGTGHLMLQRPSPLSGFWWWIWSWSLKCWLICATWCSCWR